MKLLRSDFYKRMYVSLDCKPSNGKSILRDKQNMIREFHAGRLKLAKEYFNLINSNIIITSKNQYRDVFGMASKILLENL